MKQNNAAPLRYDLTSTVKSRGKYVRCWLQSNLSIDSHPGIRADSRGYDTSFRNPGTAIVERDCQEVVIEVARPLDSWLKTDDNFVKLLTFKPSPNRKIVDWPYRPDLKHALQ
ncbi:hypothetical protein CA54_14370 [Symmachiella macrocystis]|uniref:Uncharacterized protein n=1 Tax=Symmachiella macrocystis TaxID=2527985 RepID=A0A5C6BKE4_9PLAN|nr:hypothetical protein CA54_14370 [Symmachiella macrocystis]